MLKDNKKPEETSSNTNASALEDLVLELEHDEHAEHFFIGKDLVDNICERKGGE